jgi:hypothetical protein
MRRLAVLLQPARVAVAKHAPGGNLWNYVA